VKTEVLREKPVSLPLCSPQIPHTLLREWTRPVQWEDGNKLPELWHSLMV